MPGYLRSMNLTPIGRRAGGGATLLTIQDLFFGHAISIAVDMKCPAEVYQPCIRAYKGLPDIDYPFHDKIIVVTNCGRICLGRKKINFSTVFAGQAVGIKEVHDDILRELLRCSPKFGPGNKV